MTPSSATASAQILQAVPQAPSQDVAALLYPLGDLLGLLGYAGLALITVYYILNPRRPTYSLAAGRILTAFFLLVASHNLWRLFNFSYPSLTIAAAFRMGQGASILALSAWLFRHMGSITKVVESAHAREQEEHEQERRVAKTILDNAIDGILTFEASGLLIDLNPATERMFGCLKADLEGKGLIDVLVPARHREKTWQRLLDPKRGLNREFGERHLRRLLRADGTEFLCEVVIVENGARGKEAPTFTGFLRDVTLDRAAAEERERLLIAAQAASAAKNEFLAVVSHELRTPLAAVVGYTELISEGVLGDVTAQQQQALSRVTLSAQHLVGLIDQILDLAAVEGGQKITVKAGTHNLAEIVTASADLVLPNAQDKRLNLTTRCDPNLSIVTDSARLQQILVNLLSNAVKFTAKGSVTLGADANDGGIVIQVTDTGRGISEEDQGKVFEKFWRAERGTTRSVGGTGLGLTITKELAVAIRGEISLRSSPEQGSTFTLKLPRDMTVNTHPGTGNE